MFQLANKRIVMWPVSIPVPRGDGSGEVDVQQCKLQFVLFTEPELAELKTKTGTQMLDMLVEHITGWEDIEEPNGEPVEFNKEVLRAALNDPLFSAAVVRALYQASNGRAAAKNS